MTLPDSVRICFGRYADFTGRASRAEYWWFFLFFWVAGIIVGNLEIWIFATPSDELGVLDIIFLLATIIPSIAVGGRRLHDIDRSGWWQLLFLVPVIGWLILFVFLAMRGTQGDNRFGPDPIGSTHRRAATQL